MIRSWFYRKHSEVKIFRIIADFYLLAVVSNKGSAVLQNHFLRQIWSDVLNTVQFDSVAFYLTSRAFHEKICFVAWVYHGRHPSGALVLFKLFFRRATERRVHAVLVDIQGMNDAFDEIIVAEYVAVLFLPFKPFGCLFFFRCGNRNALDEARQALVAKNLLKRIEESFDRFCLCVLHSCKNSSVLLFPLGFSRHYIYDKPFRIFHYVASVVGMVQICFIQETNSVILQAFYDVIGEF